ncbi:MAG: DUF1553 domain-containing protein [Bryobacterales bacterium]|nr:DUF1553 domain-containing protein [Bryobacterales bacterium]
MVSSPILRWTVFLAAAFCALPGLLAAPRVEFNRDVRPILSDKCYTCHGPDESKRLVGLRLDTRDGLLADRGKYQIVVPGDPGKSKLLERMAHPKRALAMPPPGSGDPLTPAQLEVITEWIRQGAEFESHWSFTAPRRPDPPSVSDEAWVRNAIDRFVLARLDREQLKPAREADKTTLLRRLHFDLTGLPPSPQEIDSFLADRAPDAYEKRVDALLASPRYGERMAMQWLDLARYADTHGFHIDSHRDMWLWRDWVIDAFNRNMPYDQFSIWQLAGDLLPNRTREQRIASGFNRNHMINYEGGAIPEEYQTEYVVDRVDTTATVWLGLTMGCARCHDHKYDPIKQTDFYRFYAFFNTVDEEGLDGKRGNATPFLRVFRNEVQEQQWKQAQQRLHDAKQALCNDTVDYHLSQWEPGQAAQLPVPSYRSLLAHYSFDHHLETASPALRGKVLRGEARYVPGMVADRLELDGETTVAFGDAFPFGRNDAFSIAFWVHSSSQKPMSIFQQIDDASTRKGIEFEFDESYPIPDEIDRGVYLTVRLAASYPASAIEVTTVERVRQKGYAHIALNYDGSGRASGVQLWVNGKAARLRVKLDNLVGSFRSTAPMRIADPTIGSPFNGNVDDLRIYRRTLTAAEIEQLHYHEPARATLHLPDDSRSREQRDLLRRYYLENAASPVHRRAWEELQAATKSADALAQAIPTTMVMEEMLTPRITHRLERGDYSMPAEPLDAGVPAVLPALPEGAPLNRLTLAQWLMQPDHPLTARVAANRFWQMTFGQGIVKTSEDFGAQGDAPSHPEMLDWLATEFTRSGWDVKHMMRTIVTSSTYRMASQATPALIERDPENRLLARGPRVRLPAEMIRDSALSASGLLHGPIGGPSVFPYQPDGVWEDMAFGDVYSVQRYEQSHGKDLYRRTMYTFWKRTAPPPTLVTFDAPDREKCTARRTNTNTPLQALVLLNDPTYVEASRALAQRVLKEAAPDPGSRIRHAFRLVTARDPNPRELQALRDLAETQIARYRRDPEAAKRLLKVGESPYDQRLDARELAGWATVASVILNLDEAITKE